MTKYMDSILDKIRKLLRLSNSSNPHEAANALARAFEMARKHQIDLNTIDLADDEIIDRILIRHGARLTFERQRILGLIKHFFRVDVIICSPNTALVGRATDLAIAHYVHDFLLTSLRAGLRQFQRKVGRKLSRTRRESYIQGWIYGVAQKLDATQTKMALEDSRFALVTTDSDPRVAAEVARMYPNTETRKPQKVTRRNHNALTEGLHKGRSVNINQPLQQPEPLALEG